MSKGKQIPLPELDEQTEPTTKRKKRFGLSARFPIFANKSGKKQTKDAILIIGHGESLLQQADLKTSETLVVEDKEVFYHAKPTLLGIKKKLIFPRLYRFSDKYFYFVTHMALEHEPITRAMNTGKAIDGINEFGRVADKEKIISKMVELGIFLKYGTDEYFAHYGEQETPTGYRVHPSYEAGYPVYDISDIDAINAEVKHIKDHELQMGLIEAMNYDPEKNKMKDFLWLAFMAIFGVLFGIVFNTMAMTGNYPFG